MMASDSVLNSTALSLLVDVQQMDPSINAVLENMSNAKRCTVRNQVGGFDPLAQTK